MDIASTPSLDLAHGEQMLALCKQLYPICRSLTGDGFRQSLRLLQQQVPALQMHEVPSGTQVFDWTVPKEWNVREAWIKDPTGQKICDLAVHNLHLMGYSVPVHCRMPLAELQAHLYSLPEQPDAIPYITSYYKERWGFCLTQQQRDALIEGDYEVYIDSSLTDGSLTYGDLLIPGDSPQEILLSSYLCHPSMANNELSGPVVTMALAAWLQSLPQRRYSYRIVIIPETIGSITYLSRHVAAMKARTIAGFVVTCIGDERTYSYLESRLGNSKADRVAQHVLSHLQPDYARYSFLARGSDERQYCAPGIDLPVCSIMRTKYAEYPEYHTSLDDFSVVTANGLAGGFLALQQALSVLEHDAYYRATVFGEPQLGKRGLYPTISTKETTHIVANMMDLLAYCDGQHSLLDIAERLNVSFFTLLPIAKNLEAHQLLSRSLQPTG
ncbi:MAG TPA: aminopeptidase [Rheinheimera sp.]|nr:aminopeptidase [Rheinheimera sp.]